MEQLKGEDVQIIVYEPLVDAETFESYTVIKDLELFKLRSDVIVANRLEKEVESVKEKIITRDVFGIS